MSSRAVAAVWEHSRAKGSNRLALLAIAECAQQNGRDAFMGIASLASDTRLSQRAVRYILHKLEADGEIVIEWNTEGRVMRTSSGREFCPQWFIHVRCLSDQEAYQRERKPEKFSSGAFKVGRPRTRKSLPISTPLESEKIAPQSENLAPKSEKSRPAYKEDPSRILEQDPRTTPHTRAHRHHAFCPPDGTSGFCVPDFLHHELRTMLGSYAAGFDLPAWYAEADARRAREGPAVLNGLTWWREQLRAELVARGWAEPSRPPSVERQVADRLGPGYVPFECPHTPACSGRNACHMKSTIAEARVAS